MSFNLWDFAEALVVARRFAETDTDPAKIDATEARTMRRRLAGIAWLPGAGLMLLLGGATNSALVGVAGFVVLLVALWLFAERGDRFGDWVRRDRNRA
jgi:hypothetical protein